MKRYLPLFASAAICAALPASAQDAKTYPAPSEIVAAAKAEDWVAIAPSDILVMDLAPDSNGKSRRVIIQLMPAPFSQGWVSNIRKLAAAHWWDGTSINRVQDNYVVQWAAKPESGKELVSQPPDVREQRVRPERLSAEYERPIADVAFTPSPFKDSYAEAGFVSGWQAARDQSTGTVWLAHCYGTVGVGRDMPPDTGDGAELYAVIGHGPRHLDRNIANVGRVLAGIEPHAALPRGTEALGFYKDEHQRTKITRVRLASQIPGFPRWQMMDTASPSFAQVVQARANRTGFFVRQAGAADLCTLKVPVREVK